MKQFTVLISICFLLFGSCVFATGELTFIENKGQWHQNALLKAYLDSNEAVDRSSFFSPRMSNFSQGQVSQTFYPQFSCFFCRNQMP